MRSLLTPFQKVSLHGIRFSNSVLMMWVLFLWTSQTGNTQPGLLDVDFGQEGITTIALGVDHDEAFCTLLQPDGKILASGMVTGIPVLIRYLPDGTPDPAFGKEGVKKLEGYFLQGIYAMALTSDQKILLSGNGIETYLDILRLDPDGSLDESFADHGAFTLDLTVKPFIQSLVIQPDGKILAAGFTSEFGMIKSSFVFRMLPEGLPDPDFGNNGFVSDEDINGLAELGPNGLVSMTLQPDGKIVATGSYWDLMLWEIQGIVFRLLPNGEPDPSFGEGGLTTTGLFIHDFPEKVLVQPDGKIVVAGYTMQDFMVLRLLPDGTRDESFADDGVLIKDLNGEYDRLFSMVLQPDGRILTAGQTGAANQSDFVLMRLDSDGTLDPTFGTDGTVITVLGQENDLIQDLALQPDGRIVVAGSTTNSGVWDVTLARYATDGDLDETFGDDGIVVTPVAADVEKATSLTLTEDGTIITASPFFKSSGYRTALLAFTESGGPEPAFGTNGFQEVQLFYGDYNKMDPHSLEITEEGKFLLGGSMGYTKSLEPYSYIARYFPDGKESLGFGTNGMIRDETGFESHVMTQQPDQKILVGGVMDGDFVIKRYTYYGQPDPGFGIDGVVKLDISGEGSYDEINDLLPLPDGKILAGGGTMNGGLRQFAMALFNAEGSLDPSFGNDGILTMSVGDGHCCIRSLHLQEDGKILVVGNAVSDPGVMLADCDAFAMVRFLPNGAIDESFGDEGYVLSWLALYDASMQAMCLQPDGKILVGGYVVNQLAPGKYAGLIRYLPDGNLDPTFGLNGVVYLALPNSSIHSLFLQPDNSILAGGAIGGDLTLYRFLSGLETGILDFTEPVQTVWVYPNPLGNQATLMYTLETLETLSIELYDMYGRKVQTILSNAERWAGEHQETLILDANLPAGSYRIVITNGAGSRSIQVMKQ